MDFLEQVFGISPDGGSGTTELLFLILPILVAAFVMVRRYRRN